jgi:hypothetical protein
MSIRFGPIARPRRPDVVDLTTARQSRQPSSAHWFCPVCDLVAGDFTPTECSYLATVHDQVQHGSRPTASVVLGPAAPVPALDATGERVGARTGATAGTGLGIGA